MLKRTTVKRLVDILGALVGLIILSPVMLVVALVVYISMEPHPCF
ncbi:MAG: sugar transferase [Coprothermobacter sp.]|nr:sugar transferase [Coprothermobacter sp.]